MRPFTFRVPRPRRQPPKHFLFLEALEDRTLLNGSLADFRSLAIDPTTYDNSSILVRFRPEALDTLATFPGVVDLGRTLPLVSGLHEVPLPAGMTVEQALAIFQGDDRVLYAQPNYRVHVTLTPNDARFTEQYALNNTGQTGGTPDADIDAPEAWDTYTGNPNTIVAVIDTGVDYNHPDLKANMWTNAGEIPGNGVDDDQNGYVDDIHGYNFVSNTGDPMDDYGHGTHVAGTIGAVSNNGEGVAGIAWDVKIMAVKFLDSSGSGTLTGAIDALNYAVTNGATISNNSWGGGGYYQPLKDAIASAALKDHIFIAAAGNDTNNNDSNPSYPASYDLANIISVAATDHNDELAYFSNFGALSVDLGAPGVDILSTVPTSGPLSDPSGYKKLSGTSMATPHVTGVVALVRGLHPDWTYSQVISQVLNTVDLIPSLDGKTLTGGRLNAAGAVTGTPPPDTTGPRVVASSPNGSVTGPVSSLRVTFNERIDTATFTLADIASFTGPGGDLTATDVQVVAGSLDRQFDITFAAQSALGDYQLVLGPDIADAAGNLMNQDRDTLNGEPTQDQYSAKFTIAEILTFSSTDVPKRIDFLWSAISELVINQDITIGDLNVTFNIRHDYVGDLVTYLISPAGVGYYLTIFNGAGANFEDTTFDDEASTDIGSGSAPFHGSYRPVEPLSNYDGLNARGTWLLGVDNYGFFNGVLNSWSMAITPGGGSPPAPPPPAPPPPNSPPQANPDSAVTDEDIAVTINVLANDSDPDGDPLTVVSVENLQGGSAVINLDNTITFTPDANFNGWASFTYTISDGQATASSWVSITVNPVNDPPVAVNDVVAAFQDTDLTIMPNTLVSNDTDVDGDALFIAAVGNAVHGTVVIDLGAVVFTPEAGYAGWASFEYTVSDGQATSTARVDVNVQAVYYLSLTSGGTLTNSDGSTLTFANADILSLTVGADGAYTYRMFFDGSDVGLTQNIDAFTFLNGTIILSTAGAFTAPGTGVTGAGEDLWQFNPAALGDFTAGSWSFHFDGSDVGLSGSLENVDAVGVLPDGRILLSTVDVFSVPGVATGGQDEDLLVFTPTSLGSSTSGTWAMYFDGSDVGLASNSGEDVNALYVKSGAGLPTLYFSTTGSFGVSGLSGANEDVFAFQPTNLGWTTTGSFGPGLTLDGSLYGLASYNVDGVSLGPSSMQPMAGPLGAGAKRKLRGKDVGSAEGSAANVPMDAPAPGTAGDLVLGAPERTTDRTAVAGVTSGLSKSAVDVIFRQVANAAEKLSSSWLDYRAAEGSDGEDVFSVFEAVWYIRPRRS